MVNMVAVDVTSLIALIVSLVALLIASIQMIQQLYATAYDYRRCSPRTMGGWARLSRRQWIWEEVRFEVTFSTPRIKIDPRQADSMMEEELEQQDYKGYEFNYAPHREKLKRTEPPTSGNKPWFLCAKNTIPEAKCSWLALLEDTKFTNLQVVIHENVSSCDYAPDGFTRPFASADRISFLTLMTLFGVRWDIGGKDGQLAGAGQFCEVSVINNPYYGQGYVYHDLNRQRERSIIGRSGATNQPACSWRYYLASEEARLAMFRCFNLGFATFKTHDDTELRGSLQHPEVLPSDGDRETVNLVVGYYNNTNGWCPGLSEAILFWAYESMPKMVDKNNSKFKSVFSARFVEDVKMGTSGFIAMLLGDGNSTADTIPSVANVTEWAKDFLQMFPEVVEKVYDCLKWAADCPIHKNNLIDRDVPWVVSRGCLEGIRELDKHVERLLLANFAEEKHKTIKSFITNQQIMHGSKTYSEAEEAAQKFGTHWRDEFDRVGSEHYDKIVANLAQFMEAFLLESESRPLLAQRIIINRLMRGSLWVVHNGNAFENGKVPGCNLSSNWLVDNPIVYIS